jgi:hypothetical protein
MDKVGKPISTNFSRESALCQLVKSRFFNNCAARVHR